MLLRAGVEFFSSWGMELLVTQLHDHSKAVSMEALDILDEACEDKVTAAQLTLVKAEEVFKETWVLTVQPAPLCWPTGKPSCSDPAETSFVPPGRQRPPPAAQVGPQRPRSVFTSCLFI